MAIGILHDEYMRHLYAHDVESFVYVLNGLTVSRTARLASKLAGPYMWFSPPPQKIKRFCVHGMHASRTDLNSSRRGFNLS